MFTRGIVSGDHNDELAPQSIYITGQPIPNPEKRLTDNRFMDFSDLLREDRGAPSAENFDHGFEAGQQTMRRFIKDHGASFPR